MMKETKAEMGFHVSAIDNSWADYGVVQKVGTFGDYPKRYKVIEIRGRVNENVVKSPGFIPLPTEVARMLTRKLAKELNLEIKNEEEGGERYTVRLLSQQQTGEVQVGDLVRWGLSISNRITGNFRVDGHLLRLACSNGMMVPEMSQESGISKSYDVEKMSESLIDRAKFLQDTFEEQLEFFRDLKHYNMNREFAELLARSFPAPIINNVVKVGKKHVVEGFESKNLWDAYSDITYQISHRSLKLATRAEWGIKATRLFEEFVRENATAERA